MTPFSTVRTALIMVDILLDASLWPMFGLIYFRSALLYCFVFTPDKQGTQDRIGTAMVSSQRRQVWQEEQEITWHD